MTAPGNQASYKASMINQLESARDKYIADANNLIDLLKVDTFVDNVVSTDTISGFAYPVDNNITNIKFTLLKKAYERLVKISADKTEVEALKAMLHKMEGDLFICKRKLETETNTCDTYYMKNLELTRKLEAKEFIKDLPVTLPEELMNNIMESPIVAVSPQKKQRDQFKEPAPKVTKKTAIEDLSEARAANETQSAPKKKRTLKKNNTTKPKKAKGTEEYALFADSLFGDDDFDDIEEDLILVADSQKPSTNKKK
jgi:hypothetical protein